MYITREKRTCEDAAPLTGETRLWLYDGYREGEGWTYGLTLSTRLLFKKADGTNGIFTEDTRSSNKKSGYKRLKSPMYYPVSIEERDE